MAIFKQLTGKEGFPRQFSFQLGNELSDDVFKLSTKLMSERIYSQARITTIIYYIFGRVAYPV